MNISKDFSRNLAKYLKLILLTLIPFGILTCIFLAIYASGQHIIRQSANDPQIQMAEDGALQLEAGVSAFDVIPKGNVDLEKSLSPFMIIYNEQGQPIISSGVLKGNIPLPPPGVFNYTRKFGEERVTWQPEENVRIATVIKHFDGSSPGFVLTGRSLREVEERETFVMFALFTAWAGSFLLALIWIFLYYQINLKDQLPPIRK